LKKSQFTKDLKSEPSRLTAGDGMMLYDDVGLVWCVEQYEIYVRCEIVDDNEKKILFFGFLLHFFDYTRWGKSFGNEV
jgi:hypothetical protein